VPPLAQAIPLLEEIRADFLRWAREFSKHTRGGLFDCIVMNPPFAARRHQWKSFAAVKELAGVHGLPNIGPVEVGFVIGAIALLKPKGRLLAILPASMVSAPASSWLREFMTSSGAIRHVHELPRFTFPEIESRIYLVVYEKGSRRESTALLNHDLQNPERMSIATSAPASAQRLDFGFHNSAAKARILEGDHSLGWQPLGDIVHLWRGTQKTPQTARSVVHTGNYRDGFWRGNGACSVHPQGTSEQQIQAGDILVKRVSRNCASSFGLAAGIRGALVSDCVLVMRPRHRVSSIRLLFAMRCLMALDFGPALLEKGTGASYLAQKEMVSFKVPYSLSQKYPGQFKNYVRAVRCRCFPLMRTIESAVQRRLLKAITLQTAADASVVSQKRLYQ